MNTTRVLTAIGMFSLIVFLGGTLMMLMVSWMGWLAGKELDGFVYAFAGFMGVAVAAAVGAGAVAAYFGFDE